MRIIYALGAEYLCEALSTTLATLFGPINRKVVLDSYLPALCIEKRASCAGVSNQRPGKFGQSFAGQPARARPDAFLKPENDGVCRIVMSDELSTFAFFGSSINEISGCYPKGSFGATFVLARVLFWWGSCWRNSPG